MLSRLNIALDLLRRLNEARNLSRHRLNIALCECLLNELYLLHLTGAAVSVVLCFAVLFQKLTLFLLEWLLLLNVFVLVFHVGRVGLSG